MVAPAVQRAAAFMLASFAVSRAASTAWQVLDIDAAAGGQTFLGLGGISGGGATSRLLIDYPEAQKSQILDYLFTPNYGASLQVIKVEIGGDSQSTDGTESSHMHSADVVDYNTGYEWWLLKEAKKRNPEIKTYGLPWAYPGWVGGPEKTGSPFAHPELTSKYILKWLEGARHVYGIEIDYIGIWNERASDADYAKTLRKTLDEAGFQNTTLVAKDGDSSICDEMASDPAYVEAIGVVGLHYPSDFQSYDNCKKLGYGVEGGKPLWASEESSSYDDLNGAACWARIVTSHWVLQGMTSSIMWNLVGSYYHGTNWYASSMLTAVEPWSGNYNALEVVWATAHITQFTRVGWTLLKVGSGSGELPGGGFYATYADTKSGDWTLTVVKIDEDHAPCTRPPLPHFNVSAETVTFRLATGMRTNAELAVWYSNFEEFNGDGSVRSVFQRMPNIVAKDALITLDVAVGAFYTVSTILDGPTKGAPPSPIPSSEPLMPLPYDDNFESYTISQEGKWWADQIGAFEVHLDSSGLYGYNKVMRQMVPQLPIGWSDHGSNGPMTLLGMREWQDITIAADIRLPANAPVGAAGCVATRLDQMWSNGIALCVSASGNYTLSVGGPKLEGKPSGEVIKTGVAAGQLPPKHFSRLSLTTVGDKASASLNGAELFANISIRDLDSGFAGLGASHWMPIEYDNVAVDRAGDRWSSASFPRCKTAQVGTMVRARACTTNGLASDDQAFQLLADWGLRHIASGLCASVLTPEAGSRLALAKCDPKDLRQQFKNDYTLVRNFLVPFKLKAGSGDLFLVGLKDGTVQVGATDHAWKRWSYFPNSKQLRNQYTAELDLGYPMCLSACDEESITELVV